MTNYTRLVRKPDNGTINTGLNSCPTKYLINKYGAPAKAKTVNCAGTDKLNKRWLEKMELVDIGPFKVYGHKAFLEVLKKAMDELQKSHPDLYWRISSAGCLCVRKVRGGQSWSNHSLGLAIDLKIDGMLDARGDNNVQKGLLVIYSVFKKYKLYWGAEFGIEDGMHFECSSQLIAKLEKENKI